MAKRSKSKSGLTRIGSEGGLIKYSARLIGRDPDSHKIIVDTVRTILADDIAAAQVERKRLTDEAVKAKIGQAIGGRKMRFEEAVAEWIPTVTRHSTQMAWRSYGRRVSKSFGERWLHKITQQEWQRWHGRQVGAASTIGGIKMMLMNLYDWAELNGHVANNPIEDWTAKRKRHNSNVVAKMAELETPKKKALTAAELGRYLKAHEELFPHTYPLVLTMLAMGTRYAEASALRFDDVDWATGMVTIRRGQVDGRRCPPKGDKARFAALADTAFEVLRAHVAKTGNREWLFQVPAVWFGRRRTGMDANNEPLVPVWSYDTIRNHLKTSMLSADARTDNATHAMRHTLKGLMEGEVAESVLRKVMGHSSEEIHGRYGDANVLKFADGVERSVFGGRRKIGNDV